MKQINKTCDKATNYKTWLDDIEARNENHPKYGSGTTYNLYSKDIVMNLLRCQEGLCAYTEFRLCNPEHYSDDKWSEGSYTGTYQHTGQIDHFDDDLKTNKGWLWDNLFLIYSDINTKHKRILQRNIDIDDILKPDLAVYNPNELLQYDKDTHLFIPKVSISDAEKRARISKMIHLLGLNFQPMIDFRKNYLEPIFNRLILGFKSYTDEKASLYQFYTAFEMSIDFVQISQNINLKN